MKATTEQQQLYNAFVLNQIGFSGKWEGWRMAGEYFISPDGLRMRPKQMQMLYWEHGAKLSPRRGQKSKQGELF